MKIQLFFYVNRVSPAEPQPASTPVSGGHSQFPAPNGERSEREGGGAHQSTDCRRHQLRLGVYRQLHLAHAVWYQERP